MGNIANPNSISISIQAPTKGMFNFHRDYNSDIRAQPMDYPSFLKKTDSNHIEYCVRSSYNSRQYQISYDDDSHGPALVFKKMRERSQPIWKNIAPNQMIPLFQGCVIRLADTQFQIKKLCKSFADLQQWQQTLNTGPDVDPRQSINLKLVNSRQLQTSRFLKCSAVMNSRTLTKNDSSASFMFDQQGQFCRYCYGRDNTSSNPLLNLCKCAGSVKFSHYYCLKNWITSRSSTGAADCYQYFEYDLSCELCKQKISKSVVHKGKKYVFYSESYIHPPFVVLSYKNDSSTNKVKQYIVNFDYRPNIILGKGGNADILINDRNMNNEHCQLLLMNNELLLRNFNPTYGSYVQIENSWTFSPIDNHLQIMMGNHLIRFQDHSSSCFWKRPLTLKIVDNKQQYQ